MLERLIITGNEIGYVVADLVSVIFSHLTLSAEIYHVLVMVGRGLVKSEEHPAKGVLSSLKCILQAESC